MQLSRLEIKGFKSFGEKVAINFDSGITGIVGPNGCGKSNVVDSIRWVLGEQKTRMLRSDKMENVIFNGTKKRKPTQLAEVSLTFDNTRNLLPTEYTQVTITRRYYRSGDSEYELNGVPCRLKDITDLFMDTGISSNSYAIIELKMVDDLLNDKDNSRRGLFEEAAGISKFKTRKKETLRKLNDTDADLERVEDLLFEIEKNLKSLERQAKQAEKYYKIKEDYKEDSLKLAAISLNDFTEQLDNIQQQITQQNEKKSQLSAGINQKEAEIERNKAEILTKEKLLSSRQRTLNEHVSRIRQYESDKKIKNERLRYLNDRCQKLEEQISTDKQSVERAQFAIESLAKERSAAAQEVEKLREHVQKLKTDYEEQKNVSKAHQEEVNKLTEQVRDLRQRSYQINKSVELKEVQISSLQQEMERSSSDTSTREEDIDLFKQKEEELSGLIFERETTLNSWIDEEKRLKGKVESLEKTLQVIREENQQVNRTLDSRENEYNLTKSLVENLEGFPEAIKFLKKSSKWGKDAPLLSDIIATAEKYRVTIENFMEPYMNYYVVDSMEQAYQAVNLLSDAAKGKANFFVLASFETFHGTTPEFYNNCISASEIVEYDPRYRKLVSYLLDNVYIVTGDISDIPADSDSIFITESGKVIKRRFSISGGSVGLFEGKRIGRAKNLQKLEKEIAELKNKRDSIETSLHETQENLNQTKAKLNQLPITEKQEELSDLKQELVTYRTRKEQLSTMIENAASKKQQMLEQLHNLQQELEELHPQAKETETKLSELESSLSEKNIQLHEHEELLNIKSASFNQENINFHQQENKLNSLLQEISFKESNLDANKERIQTNQEELQSTEAEIRKLNSSSDQSEEELIQMYDEKEGIESGVNEAEKSYYAARGEVDQLEKNVKDLQRTREEVDTLLNEYQQKKNEINLEQRSVRERLSVEFKIDLDKTELPQVEEDLDTVKSRVEKVRDRLDRIGPINPMAMEAYEEIKERHTFISEQKNDLIEAKESLLTTISEIDLVAKETFLQSFEKIKGNFITVFRSLFTEEDDCDLRLTDPENPLDSSIEIMAKPKGKRPLSINQLSGGEKTLTAISLLFAIYLLKPAPFCIFDEVDAPLDDANIDKFNNIIRKFSKDSQFIIVTHNKRTMSSTDVIYGITMIEQGISRVVPVDLRELA